jgi:hypothetical protein
MFGNMVQISNTAGPEACICCPEHQSLHIRLLAVLASIGCYPSMACAGTGIVMATPQTAVRQDLLWLRSMEPWAA